MTGENYELIIDNGSGFTKAGFIGQDKPIIEFPTNVGHEYPNRFNKTSNISYVGNVSDELLGILNWERPIKYGIVEDWHNMEKIWEFTFEQLGCHSRNCTVLLTESPLNPKSNREKTTEIMFEKFGVSKFFLANRSVLALYGYGQQSGIVLNSGESKATFKTM